jgi:hypothetical protein
MNEAGMVQNTAIDVITPKATSGPPSRLVSWNVTTYSGMKTLNSPNAISWKKNPSRHMTVVDSTGKLKHLPAKRFLCGE